MIINSVFADNHTVLGAANMYIGRVDESGGVGGCVPKDQVVIENSILWDNESDVNWSDLDDQLYSTCPLSVKTSNIQGGINSVYQGYGNIFEDPLMVNASAGDVRLEAGSPCIDSGNSYVDFEPMTPGFTLLPDLDPAGNPRIVDGDGDGVAEVDMGVYEYQ